MRCLVPGLGLLVSAACLPRPVVPSVRPAELTCRRQTLRKATVAGRCLIWPVYPSTSRGGVTAFVPAAAGVGGGRRRHGRKTCFRGSLAALGRNRSGVLEADSKGLIPGGDRAGLQRSSRSLPPPPPRSSSPSAATGTTAAVAALVFELQPRAEDKKTLAVYGKLHRLLGTIRARQLLGLEVVATLTSLNYLVLHHRDDLPNLFDEKSAAGMSGIGPSGARLALGDRCWDICGTGQEGQTMDYAMRRTGQERERLITDKRRLKREIKRVVKISSVSEVLSMDLSPPPRPKKDRVMSGGLLRRKVGGVVRSSQRLYARIRAAVALSRTPPSSSSSSSEGTALSSKSSSNPLFGIGLGTLMTRRDCSTILHEAQEHGKWVPWDGDLGTGATATPVEDLPLSRALWGGRAGDAVRSRIAAVYGIPQDSVVVDASGLFVCRVEVDDGERSGGEERRDTLGGEGNNGQSMGEQEGDTLDHPVRERQIPPSQQLQQSQQQQQLCSFTLTEFRRSRSLITFSVALNSEKAVESSWATCFEQCGECIRLSGQGSGVIFSGKLRHASVRTYDEDSAHDGSPVLLLRGFASILHPSVLEESTRWNWGSPAWHVDAAWVKDQDILDRVWVPGVDEPPGMAAETTDEDPPTSSVAQSAALTSAVSDAADSSGGYYLERMNSTLAHRYYRQGLEGMEIPVVDSLGYPVIDLVEDRGPSRLMSWIPGNRSSKTGEVTLKAVLRKRFPWNRRRQVGKAGMSTQTGVSPRMDAALQELFGAPSSGRISAAGQRGETVPEETLVNVPVPPIKYVFVDPRYRGLGLGRRLFLEAMRSLARRGFRYAVIVVEDNGSGGLFDFYEEMGFVMAEELLGLPRTMIAPIPPPDGM